MKQQRHTVIREVLAKGSIPSQDDLRRKLAGRGFHVTQATLSRDIHELSHRAWSEAETLDAWERLFGLQAELAVLAHEPARPTD